MSNYFVVRMKDSQSEYVKRGLLAVGWCHIDFASFANKGEKEIWKVLDREVDKGTISRRSACQIARFLSIKPGDMILVPNSWGGFYICKARTDLKSIYQYSKEDVAKDRANQILVEYAKDKNNEPVFYTRKNKNTALQTKMRTQWTVLQFKDDQTEATEEIDKLYNDGKDSSSTSRLEEIESERYEKIREQICLNLQNYNSTSLQAGGSGLEEIVKKLFELDGYSVEIPAKSKTENHGDVDIIATRNSIISDALKQTVNVQVKHHARESDSWAIEQLIEKKNQKSEDSSDVYMAMTTAEFDNKAKELADKNGVLITEGKDLAEKIILFFDKPEMEEIRLKLGFIKTYEYLEPERK